MVEKDEEKTNSDQNQRIEVSSDKSSSESSDPEEIFVLAKSSTRINKKDINLN